MAHQGFNIDREQIATALQGFSAGVGGQLPGFLEQQDRKKQRTALATKEARESSVGRQKALLIDGHRAFQLGKAGNFQAIADLMGARIGEGPNFPGVDMTATQDMFTMANRAAQGDQEAANALLPFLKRGADLAESLGVVGAPKADTVQTSKVLPGGLVQIVRKSGAVEVVSPNEAQAIQVREAEERGVELAGRREAAKGAGRGQEKVKTERSMNAILADRKKGVDLASGEAERLGKFITEGITALDALPKAKRGLELLKTVGTGGITAKSKAITDFFGTTSGDLGELNNILAQGVLDGLSAFTGAISEGERAFIEKMQTSLTTGTKVNQRILAQSVSLLERKIKRARSAAVAAGDDFSLELFDNPQGLTLAPQQTAPASQSGFKVLNIRDQ